MRQTRHSSIQSRIRSSILSLKKRGRSSHPVISEETHGATTSALRERVDNTRILKANCMGGQWSPKCGKGHMYQQCPRQPFGEKKSICWNPIPTYFYLIFSKCICNACFITYRVKQHHGTCNNKCMKGRIRECISERGAQKTVLTGMCNQDPRRSYRRLTSRLRDQQDNNV